MKLAEKHERDWDKVAQELVVTKNGRRSSRTAYECMLRFQVLDSKTLCL